MQSAKLSTLYFVLSAVFAAAAACATPWLVVQGTDDGDSVALDSSPFPMDAQIALAR
jgi:hypothetical protein